MAGLSSGTQHAEPGARGPSVFSEVSLAAMDSEPPGSDPTTCRGAASGPSPPAEPASPFALSGSGLASREAALQSFAVRLWSLTSLPRTVPSLIWEAGL